MRHVLIWMAHGTLASECWHNIVGCSVLICFYLVSSGLIIIILKFSISKIIYIFQFQNRKFKKVNPFLHSTFSLFPITSASVFLDWTCSATLWRVRKREISAGCQHISCYTPYTCFYHQLDFPDQVSTSNAWIGVRLSTLKMRPIIFSAWLHLFWIKGLSQSPLTCLLVEHWELPYNANCLHISPT